MKATLHEEKKLWKRGYKRVIGLDEAGVGPLAGPVVAGAVSIFFRKSDFRKLRKSDFPNIKDSKKLTPKARERFYKILTTHPDICWGVGVVSPNIIDRINIFNASRLAMKKALLQLEKKLKKKSRFKSRFKSRYFSRDISLDKSRYFLKSGADFLILDGRGRLDVPIPQKAIVKADEKVFSCAAASIIAKITRDRIMVRLHKKYPQYGFDKHKGYPTKLHRTRLKKYGPCGIHRRSFGRSFRSRQIKPFLC